MLYRKTEEIEQLLDGVRETHGAHSIVPYGDWDDPRSVGFTVRGIPATFSVLVEERPPQLHYDIQIESHPPGDYLYHDHAVSLWQFMQLLKLISGRKITGRR